MTDGRQLLFDLDGVLVDSTAAVEECWRRFANRHALDPETIVSRIHGRRGADVIAELLPEIDHVQEAKFMESLEVAAAHEVSALPGASKLAMLPVGSWAIVTSGGREVATARLAAAGLPCPEILVTGEDVVRGKPDPSCYMSAVRRLRTVPSKCVVFEDTVPGLTAARAAGCRAVAIATTSRPADLAEHADFVVADLSHVQFRVESSTPPRVIVEQSGSTGEDR